MSPCCARMRAFISAVRGPIESPSPKISVVTPWRMSPWERPSAMSDSVAHESMLMKPGATARPRASTVARAFARARSPTAAMRSLRMPTSARRPGAPVPSYTVPPRTITSKDSAAGATRAAARSAKVATASGRRILLLGDQVGGRGRVEEHQVDPPHRVFPDVRVLHRGARDEAAARLAQLDDLAVGEDLRRLDARPARTQVIGDRRLLAHRPAV